MNEIYSLGVTKLEENCDASYQSCIVGDRAEEPHRLNTRPARGVLGEETSLLHFAYVFNPIFAFHVTDKR